MVRRRNIALFGCALLGLFLADAKRLTLDLKRVDHTNERHLKLGDADVVVPMINDKGVLYTAEIEVGTPPQKFMLDLDTGSSDMWTLAKGVELGGGAKTDDKNHLYDVDGSSTGTSVSDDPVVIKYGSGGMTGLKTTDNVGLGGVTVKGQGFLRATKVDGMDMASGAKDPGTFDGIMGMGLPALAQDKYTPVIDNLFEQGHVSEKKFSFHLTGQGDGSKMYIGPPMADMVPNGLVTVDVPKTPRLNDFGYWLTNVDNVGVAGDDDICGSSGCGMGVVDTGTTFFALPDAHWESLVKPLVAGRKDCMEMNQQGMKFYVCMMSKYDGLADMSMTVAGQKFVFHPEDYCSKQKSMIGEVLIVGFLNIGDKIDLWILGDPFLRKIYTVFDLSDPKQPKLSFAKPSADDSPLVGPAAHHPRRFTCLLAKAVKRHPLAVVWAVSAFSFVSGLLLAWACVAWRRRKRQRVMDSGAFVPLQSEA
eukprot:128106_1